jgi:hypothetical protein
MPVKGMVLAPKSVEDGVHYGSLEKLDQHHVMHSLQAPVLENESALLSSQG